MAAPVHRFPGVKLWIRTWQVQVGRAKLYLLDTNDPANIPAYRGITTELYGGGPELRLKQEMVLGIGGWRLLRALGLQPEVCHLNEGHAAFAVLERARSYMADNGKPFDLALTVTRAGNLFTTHTPVEAGFDRFAPGLMEWYLKKYAEEGLSISFEDLLALGRRDRRDSSEPFNMAYLAIRGSGAVNGVSQLHGQVSRRIFQTLFPRWPEDRSAGDVRDERRAHAHVGLCRGGSSVGNGLRQRPLARNPGRRGEGCSRGQRLGSMAASRRWPQDLSLITSASYTSVN